MNKAMWLLWNQRTTTGNGQYLVLLQRVLTLPTWGLGSAGSGWQYPARAPALGHKQPTQRTENWQFTKLWSFTSSRDCTSWELCHKALAHPSHQEVKSCKTSTSKISANQNCFTQVMSQDLIFIQLWNQEVKSYKIPNWANLAVNQNCLNPGQEPQHDLHTVRLLNSPYFNCTRSFTAVNKFLYMIIGTLYNIC